MKPLIHEFESKDIWNADETALFWRITGGKTFACANEKTVRGRKSDKARVTILTACSMSGEKYPLLCIGKAKNPRWPVIMGRKANSPIPYTSSKKGWMTRILFEHWLGEFQATMKRAGRSVLLLVDNCPAHVGLQNTYDGSNNLRVMMLPVNTTSRLQPCDQGVIRSLKCHYRERLANELISKVSGKVSLYEGLLMVRSAWDQVTSAVIKNSWRQSGLLVDASADGLDYVVVPEDILMIEHIEDEQVIAMQPVVDPEGLMDQILNDETGSDSEGEIELDEDEDLPSVSECLKYLQMIKNKLIHTFGDVPNALLDIEMRVREIPQVQADIRDYFLGNDEAHQTTSQKMVILSNDEIESNSEDF